LDFLAGVDAVDVPVDDVVGVDVPDVAADVLVCRASSTAGIVAVILVGAADASVGAVPPRSGDKICRVAPGCRARSPTVLEGERWRPKCKSRASEGRVVDADRKSRTSAMVFECLTFNGMAAVSEMSATPGVEGVYSLLPPLIATKICRLSAGSDLLEADDVAEDDRERMSKEVECCRWSLRSQKLIDKRRRRTRRPALRRDRWVADGKRST
jgi:hypothetical protein